LCTQCFNEESEEHIARHQFGTFLIVNDDDQRNEDLAKALDSIFACESCNESKSFLYLLSILTTAILLYDRLTNTAQGFGEDEVNSHPHLHLKVICSPLFSEFLRRTNYKTCHGQQLGKKSVLRQFGSATRADCDFCKHGTF
jgi:hypothetical protein